MKRFLVITLTFLFIFICFGCSSNSSSNQNTDSSSQTVNSEQNVQTPDPNAKPWEIPFEQRNPRYYLWGETALLNDIQVLLDPIVKANGFNSTMGLQVTPSQGKIFVLVEIIIKNNTDDDLMISTENIEAYCDNVLVPTSTYTYSINNYFPMLDTLAPDKLVDGIIVYEVPENFNELEIDYKSNIYDDNKIVFKVYSEQLPFNEVISKTRGNTEN